MNNNEIIKQKKAKDKTLLNQVVYRLLEVKGIKRPCVYFGTPEYRRIRAVTQFGFHNMHISKIRWLAEKLDVPPKLIANIVKLSNKEEEDKKDEQSNE